MSWINSQNKETHKNYNNSKKILILLLTGLYIKYRPILPCSEIYIWCININDAHSKHAHIRKSKLRACHETIKPRGKSPDAVPSSSLFVCRQSLIDVVCFFFDI